MKRFHFHRYEKWRDGEKLSGDWVQLKACFVCGKLKKRHI